jgi:hypothetical protein
MTRLEKIEKSVTELSPEELVRFRQWFEKFQAAHWDRQFETDARAGKLDRLAEEALADHRAGRTKPL